MAENKQQKKPIAVVVAELIREAVEDCGCTLWDVDFVKEGKDFNLIVTIDKEGGVTLDDCVMINDAINPILDEHDPINGSYCLEVSSPGAERELKTPEHIRAYVGSEVLVKLFAAVDGQKQLIGILSDYDEETGNITVSSDNDSTHILSKKEYSKLQLVCHF